MSTPLFMHRFGIESRALIEHGRRLRLPLRSVDDGYLLHCHLKGLFGELAPKPFALEGSDNRVVSVLGYCKDDGLALQRHAQAFADPALYQSVDWETAACKAMPAVWEPGHRLRFEVRTCPVQRLARGNPGGMAGSEVDVFLAHCSRTGSKEGADRDAVYRAWLEERVQTLGGARLDRVELASFSIERLVRRRHGSERTASVLDRPVATFRGELTVSDGPAFARLLARGIGKHRAFGFGMLLLRPVG